MVSSTSHTDFSFDRKRSLDDDDVQTISSKKRRRDGFTPELEEKLGRHQEVLLLHGPKQRYVHTKDYEIPVPKDEKEMLVKIQAIGLNPIDWKAPLVSSIQVLFE